MSEPTYGEHLYNYLAGLDYEGLHFEEEEARKWVAEVESLLRVARATKLYVDAHGKVPMDVWYEKLVQALKEVEDLL